MKYLAIGAAGFLGALARYLITGMTRSVAGSAFPWGTLVVNISGSFLLGLMYAATAQRAIIDPQWRLVIAVGFIGSYTTFSTFSLETFKLLEAGNWPAATGNILGSLIVSLAAVYSGIALGRLV